ncbi:Uncharacterised protein [uncultured archaeon]|nr:Uncharacterised protein [uncultured archaeon]
MGYFEVCTEVSVNGGFEGIIVIGTKWKLLMRPDAVEHFTSKHPVTKEELEGILDKPKYVKRVSKNRYKFLGRGRSGRYLTIVLEGRGTVYEIVTVRPSEKDEKLLYQKKSK